MGVMRAKNSERVHLDEEGPRTEYFVSATYFLIATFLSFFSRANKWRDNSEFVDFSFVILRVVKEVFLKLVAQTVGEESEDEKKFGRNL